MQKYKKHFYQHTENEDIEAAEAIANAINDFEKLLQQIDKQADEICGPFRAPGFRHQIKLQMMAKLNSFKL